MLDTSTYYTTHIYYQQKQAELLYGVSSGDSGHPQGLRTGCGVLAASISQHEHWSHVLPLWKTIKLYLRYTSTGRLSKDYIRNNMRPQALSPVPAGDSLFPGGNWALAQRHQGEWGTLFGKQGPNTTPHDELWDSSSSSTALPGPGMLCPGRRPKDWPK